MESKDEGGKEGVDGSGRLNEGGQDLVRFPMMLITSQQSIYRLLSEVVCEQKAGRLFGRSTCRPLEVSTAL